MNKTLKNILFLLTAFSLSKIVGAFTSFAIPKLLEPKDYGTWVILLLIVSYSPIIALGTVEALLRQYPYYIGEGKFAKAKEIEGSVFSSIVISSSFLILLSLSSQWLIHYPSIDPFKEQIRLIIFAAALSLYAAFFFHRFAAHQHFRIYGIIDTVRAIITLLFVCSFAWLWGLDGAVYGYLATELTICMILVLMSIKYCGNIQTCFVVRNIWEAVKIGFPITIVWWALAFQTSLDRVISSSMLGQTQTGYYGLGISVVGTLLLIPQAIAKVLYPKINEGIGKKLDFKGLSILVVVPVRILSIIIPLISGMLVITLPLIYSHIFPKYKPGLLSAQILMVGFFFVALIGNGVNYLVARNRQNILFILVISSIVINATVAIILIKLGLGIEGVAIGTCIAAFALATSIWSMVLSNLGYDNKALLKEIFNLYSPFLLAIGLILIISCFSPSFIKSTSMLSIAYLCLFIICYLAISLFIPPYKRVSRGLFEFVSIRTRRVRL